LLIGFWVSATAFLLGMAATGYPEIKSNGLFIMAWGFGWLAGVFKTKERRRYPHSVRLFWFFFKQYVLGTTA